MKARIDPDRGAILLLLVGSVACHVLAPALLPETYSWISRTTSEAAAQGLEGAWLTRLGFLLWGFAVLWLARLNRERWGVWGFLLLGCFGVMMIGTAAFSHRPWIEGVPVDVFEDLLHSVTATVMGFAFAAGVMVVALRRPRTDALVRAYDVIAVAASVVLPIAMGLSTEYTGLFQRLMFVIAYVWYAGEALRSDPAGSPLRRNAV